MDSELVSALISSFIGGVVVAVINHLLTRHKTNAEIRHIELNNEKLTLEIKRLRSELQDVKTNILDKISVTPTKSITIAEETYRLPGDFDNER